MARAICTECRKEISVGEDVTRVTCPGCHKQMTVIPTIPPAMTDHLRNQLSAVFDVYFETIVSSAVNMGYNACRVGIPVEKAVEDAKKALKMGKELAEKMKAGVKFS